MRPLRQLLLTLLIGCAVPLLGACASDTPMRPELPDRPSVERPEGLVPDGVSDMRSDIADRRSESRDLMDSALIGTSTLDTHESGPGFFDAVGGFLDSTLSLFSLHAFGLW